MTTRPERTGVTPARRRAEARARAAAQQRAQPDDPAAIRLKRAGGVSALLVGVLFLIAAIDLARNIIQPSLGPTWFSQLQNNWLMVIIKLHAGFQNVPPDGLYGLNFLDLLLLFLIGIVYLGLYAALRKASQKLSLIALALPFLGMLVFIVTSLAGRSAVMAAGVVISLAMLRSRLFDVNTAGMVLFASVLLLVGDFTVGATPAYIFAFLTALGYILLTIWFFRIGRILLLLKDDSSKAKE